MHRRVHHRAAREVMCRNAHLQRVALDQIRLSRRGSNLEGWLAILGDTERASHLGGRDWRLGIRSRIPSPQSQIANRHTIAAKHGAALQREAGVEGAELAQ